MAGSQNCYSIFLLIIFWYCFSSINVAYSKHFCNSEKFGLEVAVVTLLLLQYIVGSIPFLVKTIILKRLTDEAQISIDKQDFLVSLFYLLGNMSALVSLTFTSVSLNQVLKALEPLFSALLSATIFKTYLSSNQVLYMLIAITGACICALKDLKFSWFAVTMAFASNIAFASRNVFLKLSLRNQSTSFEQQGKMSLCAAVFLVPFWSALCMLRANEIATIFYDFSFFRSLMIIASSHALYNFCSISVLSKVENVVEHALINIMKRPFTIFATSFFDWKHADMTSSKALGVALLVLGQTLFKFDLKCFQKPKNSAIKITSFKIFPVLVLFLTPFLFYRETSIILSPISTSEIKILDPFIFKPGLESQRFSVSSIVTTLIDFPETELNIFSKTYKSDFE